MDFLRVILADQPPILCLLLGQAAAKQEAKVQLAHRKPNSTAKPRKSTVSRHRTQAPKKPTTLRAPIKHQKALSLPPPAQDDSAHQLPVPPRAPPPDTQELTSDIAADSSALAERQFFDAVAKGKPKTSLDLSSHLSPQGKSNWHCHLSNNKRLTRISLNRMQISLGMKSYPTPRTVYTLLLTRGFAVIPFPTPLAGLLFTFVPGLIM